jgi:ribosomal protein S18 acetylase RimI-like enzyme
VELELEILDLRHFSSDDVRSLLDEEVQVWAKLLEWDYRSSTEMILRYLDTKVLPGYAAVERGRILGYSFFVYEGSKGVIGDLFVSSDERVPDRQHVQVELLRHVIETLQQSPGIHRVESQLLLHQSGAVSQPFAAQGFSRHARLFMLLPLNGVSDKNQVQESSHDSSIEIRRWADSDYQAAAALITAAYRGHVDAQINDQYRSLAGSLRFLNNIVRFPGCGTFDPYSSFVAVQKGTKTLAGLILSSRVRSDVAHVTQVCVLPEFRSHGIGEALLGATTQSLRNQKFTLLSLTVTEANARAVELYERLGFATTRVFDAFVWEG